MNYLEKYHFWLENEYFDKQAKEELRALEGDEEEIKDRFYKNLEFGTGGLRGKIAMGTNRMNIYTVSRATQGLADYIIEKAWEQKDSQQYLNRGVVIAYDCRHKSREFSETIALVLNANNIKTYLFEDVRPTPELSFAVRHLHAVAGIVVTASHNPPEYNGYKVYGPDGGQIIPEIADRVITHINRIKDYSLIKKLDRPAAVQKGLFNIVSPEVDEVYLRKVKELAIRDKDRIEIDKNIKIVYTPLHGAGNIPIRRILKERGFTNVFVVEEQVQPDPDFSTVESPNPEYPAAFELAIKLGLKVNAEILIATDPDSDRIGLAVKNPTSHCEEQSDEAIPSKIKNVGQASRLSSPSSSMSFPRKRESSNSFTVLNGNQVGILLLYYILSSKKELNQLPPNGFIVKTVVTSDMSRVIADSFGVETYETLTGFKFICNMEKKVQEKEGKEFLFGYEESIGYLTGDFVRDKDAVISAMLIAEMTAYYIKNGFNLLQVLKDLYKKYGYYEEYQHSIYLEGAEGEKKIAEIMKAFRKKLPEVKGIEMVRIEDYEIGESYDLKLKKTSSLALARSNVLKIIFSDGSWYVLRPSGTEPKIKLYLSFHAKTRKEAQQKVHLAKSTILQKINSIIKPIHP
ncbi:phospho-sugar mutase [Candidatus Atribacteria bacterium 1244-E10-H5-B2]|nr:MAG: phospho-sugar mutase [Candidatus Atribacteria bacterium 1244-E10-H5-B2]